MADENMTGSEQTTEAPASPTAIPTPTPQPTSTTPTPTPAADGDPGTLLTPAAAEQTKVEEAPALTPEQQTAADAKAALFGAPESDYEITGLPEGMAIDTEALAQFSPLAKELGLSNEGMSKVAAAYANILPKVTEGVVEGIQRDIAAQHATWATETLEAVKTDPAFAGKQLSEVQQTASKALDRFGGEAFRQYLNDTGLGNHPDMVKFAFLAGSAISEDTTFERGGVTTTPKSSVDKFYG